MFLRGADLIKDARGIASLVSAGLKFNFPWHAAKYLVLLTLNISFFFLHVDWDATSLCSICSSICSCYHSCTYGFALLCGHCSKRCAFRNYCRLDYCYSLLIICHNVYIGLLGNGNETFVVLFLRRSHLRGRSSITFSAWPWRSQEAFCRFASCHKHHMMFHDDILKCFVYMFIYLYV